jgi:hypothetical protein
MALERVSAEQPMSTLQPRSPAPKPPYAADSDKIEKIRATLVEMFEDNDRKLKEAFDSGRVEAIKQLTKDKLSNNANDRVPLSTETFNENKDPAKVSRTVLNTRSKITDEFNDLDQRMSKLSHQIPELNPPANGKISASKISGGSAPAA